MKRSPYVDPVRDLLDEYRRNSSKIDVENIDPVRNNAKVLLFFNVGWWIGFRRAWRASDPFVRALAATGLIYLALAYVVVYIRELRHFLPLAILIIPFTLDRLIEALRGHDVRRVGQGPDHGV